MLKFPNPPPFTLKHSKSAGASREGGPIFTIKIYPPHWSLSDWSSLARSDPGAAADRFFDHLSRLPASQVKAAIASTISRSDLSSAFERSAARPDLPLAGAPYLLKDLYDVAGWETNASSLFLSEERPAPNMSSALAQDWDAAGGVFAGKTHLVEFAFGMEGSNCHFGDGVHPGFPDRVSGGSSSGSAWAVASGLVPLASGSDTGGSVRVPAAYNGLFGLRATPNHAWSKLGCFPLSPSFDTAGWFTRTAEDMTTTIDALFPAASGDEHPTSIKGLELLPDYEFLDDGLREPHQKAIDSLPLERSAEATQAFHALPDRLKAYLTIQSSEALEVHRNWHDKRKSQYDPQTWERIAVGKKWTPADLKTAAETKAKVTRFFQELFRDYDFVALPTAPVPAPLLGRATALREAHLDLTTPASLAGLPTLTIPYFMDSGLSGGLQIIAPDLDARSLAVWKRLLNR